MGGRQTWDAEITFSASSALAGKFCAEGMLINSL
jgi:hypothetical protein